MWCSGKTLPQRQNAASVAAKRFQCCGKNVAYLRQSLFPLPRWLAQFSWIAAFSCRLWLCHQCRCLRRHRQLLQTTNFLSNVTPLHHMNVMYKVKKKKEKTLEKNVWCSDTTLLTKNIAFSFDKFCELKFCRWRMKITKWICLFFKTSDLKTVVWNIIFKISVKLSKKKSIHKYNNYLRQKKKEKNHKRNTDPRFVNEFRWWK